MRPVSLLIGLSGCIWVTDAEMDALRDRDDDGHDAIQYGGDDCDDDDAAIHPGAGEVWYDGTDQDCDGASDDDQDGDGYDVDVDCDDLDRAIHPDAAELCNGLDDDCDGLEDDEDPDLDSDTVRFEDADSDGFGATPRDICQEQPGYVADDGDCDDADPSVHPGADELCDGADQDCDGVVDEDALDATPWYADADSDGFGDEDSTVVACEVPSGYVDVAGDCDDTDDAWYPGAPEDCSGTDDTNCDGQAGSQDDDADGFRACEDCNDKDGDINPDAIEICDGIDNDCDFAIDDDDDDTDPSGMSTWYPDADGDGYGDPDEGALSCDPPDDTWGSDDQDCDDTADTTHPDRWELCGDAVDANCGGGPDDCSAALDAADAVLWGSGFGDRAGHAVASAGDLDGDGVGDLVVSGPGASSGAGVVWLLHGPVTGELDLDADADATWEGVTAGDGVGAALVPMGTGFAAGVPGDDAAFVVSADASGGAAWTTADAVIRDTDEGDEFGFELAAGDHDDDGVAELALSAPGHSQGLSNDLGEVFLFTGPVEGSLTDTHAATRIVGGFSGGRFGRTLAFADHDADGDAELVAAGYTTILSLFDAGIVYVYDDLGSGEIDDSDATASIGSASNGSDPGDALAGGDLTGDGYEDIVISHASAGDVWVLAGPVSGDDDTDSAAVHLSGVSGFGTAVSVVDDLDGDGIGDLWIGSPGAGDALLFLGAGGWSGSLQDDDAAFTLSGAGQPGASLAAVTDLDGDTRAEVLIGAPASDSDTGAAYLLLSGGFD